MISIVTPAYEAHGRYKQFLDDLHTSIQEQVFQKWEWIICDHSVNDNIKNLVESYKDYRITYLRNTEGRGNASINMNFGIKNAKYDCIKIMHMDDFFCNENALKLLSELVEKGAKWGGLTYRHLNEFYQDDRVITPCREIIGCPSVMYFEKGNYFDPNLIYINDHEFGLRMMKKYGDPISVKEPSVTIRIHSTSVSKTSDVEAKEWEYFNTLPK